MWVGNSTAISSRLYPYSSMRLRATRYRTCSSGVPGRNLSVITHRRRPAGIKLISTDALGVDITASSAVWLPAPQSGPRRSTASSPHPPPLCPSAPRCQADGCCTSPRTPQRRGKVFFAHVVIYSVIAALQLRPEGLHPVGAACSRTYSPTECLTVSCFRRTPQYASASSV